MTPFPFRSGSCFHVCMGPGRFENRGPAVGNQLNFLNRLLYLYVGNASSEFVKLCGYGKTARACDKARMLAALNRKHKQMFGASIRRAVTQQLTKRNKQTTGTEVGYSSTN